MKRILSLILCLLFVFSLAACDNGGDTDTSSSDPSVGEPARATIRIAGMKGPTSMGLVGVMDAADNGSAKNDYKFTIAGTADEITPLLSKGELDIAAVPANLASVLYNKTNGEIQLLAVNTLGVLYVVSKGETVNSVTDLRGKTILATGKGTTPEYTLRHILIKNGIDPDNDVTLDFKSEATEVVAAMTKADNAVAMLPQPYVTVAMGKVEGLSVCLDLNDEWKKINPDSNIVTGVLVVRKTFLEENKEAVKTFLMEYESSVDFVNSDVATAASYIEKYGIFTAAVAEKAIPKCNITFISGDEMKSSVNSYLGVLYEQNPQSVGGALPTDGFFVNLG